MRTVLLGTTVALAIAGSASLAAAGQLSLSSTQMQSIYHSLASEKGQTAPSNFQPKARCEGSGFTCHAPSAEYRDQRDCSDQRIRVRETRQQ